MTPSAPIEMIAPTFWTPAIASVSSYRSPYVLRDYQGEDADGVEGLWASGFRNPCIRQATGLGKSLLAAELSRRRAAVGRVLVVVDVGTLATDLVRRITAHTGIAVGVLTGMEKDGWERRRIVVATVQSLYAKSGGRQRYADIDPRQFSGLVIDESESAVADEYAGVCRHMLNGNPELKGCGLTATPHRGDRRGLGEIFDWAPDLGECGVMNRSMRWGRDQGWLVPIHQGYVRASIDFSTVSLTRNRFGESDYSQESQVNLLRSESTLRELAKAIHAAAKGEPSVIICPATRGGKKEAEIPRDLAGHLWAEGGDDCAHAVWGGQGDRGNDLLDAFSKGKFPYVTTIKKCEKGFDADRVRHVFMLRRTKVPRVIEQGAGRAVRPLEEIRDALMAAPDADARRAIIAASAKPHATFWDLVGRNPNLDDPNLIDVLAGDPDADVRRRAKSILIKAAESNAGGQMDLEDAMRQAGAAVAAERKAEAEAREREENRRRALIQVKGSVEMQVLRDGRSAAGGTGMRTDVPERQMNILRKAKVPDKDIARMSPATIKQLSKDLVFRWKAGLCSYGQAKCLRKAGYSKDELHGMTRDAASAAIEAVKANGWRRPAEQPGRGAA